MTITKEELEARGAIAVDDPGWIRGFDDEPMFNDLDPKLDKEVEEVADRAKNARSHPAVIEAFQEAKEGNVNAVRKFRFNHQQDFVEEAWVPGRIMWLGEFLCELQKIRPDAFYAETSYRGLRGLGFVDKGVPVYSGASMPNGNAPEWSLLREDAHGVPTSEKYRGWRTVLLCCIKRKFISEQECYRVFGRPEGSRAKPWYRDIFAIKNGYCMDCGQVSCECKNKWDWLRADNYAYEVPEDVIRGRRQITDPTPSRIYVP